jgi:hypothetical protein
MCLGTFALDPVAVAAVLDAGGDGIDVPLGPIG